MIKEWNLLRTVACLSIVLLHTTTQIGRSVGYDNIENYFLLRVLLTYATPTFIVLSEIILANRYKDNLPDNFFSKRIKFILLPFLSFVVIDAFVVDFISANGTDIPAKILRNLLGGFIGYFILVIFQFYILHYIIIKFKISVEKLMPWSILIMFIHLYILNSDIPFVTENYHYLKLPFTAWFGYFTVAFLIGKYYTKIASFIKKYRWMTLIALLYVVYFIYVSFGAGVTQVDSRRLDIFPLSLAMTMVVLAWGQRIPNFKIVNLISNYSLGIYLIHWQVQRIITPHLNSYIQVFSPTVQIILLFVITIIISIIIIKLISLLPFGKYIIGNTKRTYKKRT